MTPSGFAACMSAIHRLEFCSLAKLSTHTGANTKMHACVKPIMKRATNRQILLGAPPKRYTISVLPQKPASRMFLGAYRPKRKPDRGAPAIMPTYPMAPSVPISELLKSNLRSCSHAGRLAGSAPLSMFTTM